MISVSHKNLKEIVTVAGIQIRTGNASEMAGAGKIAALWQRFFAERILESIPHRTSDSFYVVYSNYASDEYGEYDYLLGATVSSIETLPAGMTFAAIPTGEYAVVTTDRGPVAKVVMDAWKEIWSMPRTELGGRRAFLSDFEIYDRRAEDPASAEVEIHLGISPEAE